MRSPSPKPTPPAKGKLKGLVAHLLNKYGGGESVVATPIEKEKPVFIADIPKPDDSDTESIKKFMNSNPGSKHPSKIFMNQIIESIVPKTGISIIVDDGKVLKAGPKSFTERKMSLSSYKEQKANALSMVNFLHQPSKNSFKGAKMSKMSLAEKSSRDYSQMIKPDSA